MKRKIFIGITMNLLFTLLLIIASIMLGYRTKFTEFNTMPLIYAFYAIGGAGLTFFNMAYWVAIFG